MKITNKEPILAILSLTNNPNLLNFKMLSCSSLFIFFPNQIRLLTKERYCFIIIVINLYSLSISQIHSLFNFSIFEQNLDLAASLRVKCDFVHI